MSHANSQGKEGNRRYSPGEVLKVIATDPGSVLDFQGWVKTSANYELLGQEEGKDEEGRKTYIHYLRRKA